MNIICEDKDILVISDGCIICVDSNRFGMFEFLF